MLPPDISTTSTILPPLSCIPLMFRETNPVMSSLRSSFLCSMDCLFATGWFCISSNPISTGQCHRCVSCTASAEGQFTSACRGHIQRRLISKTAVQAYGAWSRPQASGGCSLGGCLICRPTMVCGLISYLLDCFVGQENSPPISHNFLPLFLKIHTDTTS